MAAQPLAMAISAAPAWTVGRLGVGTRWSSNKALGLFLKDSHCEGIEVWGLSKRIAE